MFRLFLKRKVESNSEPESQEKSFSEMVRSKFVKPMDAENRRAFSRHIVDYKHLTLLNDQDILLIRDLSLKGFSTEVAPRTAFRMNIGDTFEGRVRYLGETFDLQFRVAWKSSAMVGFEITEAPKRTFDFLNRVIKPIEIATSLCEVDGDSINQAEERKSWYHSEKSCDLFIWRKESGELTAWWLATENQFVKWTRSSEGLVTGTLLRGNERVSQAVVGLENLNFRDGFSANDSAVDNIKKQLAIDIFMAMELPIRDEILKTLSEKE